MSVLDYAAFAAASAMSMRTPHPPLRDTFSLKGRRVSEFVEASELTKTAEGHP